MASIIVITEKESGLKYTFGLPDDVPLYTMNEATDVSEFTTHPRYYTTGLSSLKTYKKVVATCERIGLLKGVTYVVTREQVEDLQRMARVSQGARAPKYGRGG